MRTFIAIRTPATRPLESVLHLLEKWRPAVQPVPAAQLHLTLAFLGDADESLVPQLADVVAEAAGSERQQTIAYRGLGAFPRLERPAVVWVGLADPDPWVRLAERLADRCEQLGFPRDRRPFHPHVTLARVKARPPYKLPAMIQDQLTAEFGTALVTSLDLYRSDLHPTGAEHTLLHSAPLQTPG